MRQPGKSIATLLVGVALLSGCSRPVATFQPSAPNRFYSPQTAVVSQPAVSQVYITETALASPVPTAVATTAPAVPQPAVSQVFASLRATYSPTKGVSQRLVRVEQQVAENSFNNTAQPVATKKISLLEQLTLKKMAKIMQRKLAPKQTNEITGSARLGLIIAGVGLVLLLIGNSFGSILGLIALLAGGALFFYSILQQ